MTDANDVVDEIMATWDTEREQVCQILLAAGRPDLVERVYAQFKIDDDANPAEPGEVWDWLEGWAMR